MDTIYYGENEGYNWVARAGGCLPQSPVRRGKFSVVFPGGGFDPLNASVSEREFSVYWCVSTCFFMWICICILVRVCCGVYGCFYRLICIRNLLPLYIGMYIFLYVDILYIHILVPLYISIFLYVDI